MGMTKYYRPPGGATPNVGHDGARAPQRFGKGDAMSLQRRVTWSESDQAAGMSLPAPYFYDESIFQQERLHIFLRSWHLVAHVSELRAPGDFVTYDILDQSVIVTRSKEGGIQAFHNVCQHRGNRLIGAPRGNTPAITCGYHAWT